MKIVSLMKCRRLRRGEDWLLKDEGMVGNEEEEMVDFCKLEELHEMKRRRGARC
jgi:hypothetical protein